MTDLKKVVNADSGTADLVGGNDWDAMADKMNNSRSPPAYTIYISGSSAVSFNNLTKETFASSSNHADVIQDTIDAVGNTSGKKIFIKSGFYQLGAALNFTAIDGYCTIQGESLQGVTQLRPTTNAPIFTIAGAKTRINLVDLYLTHNDAAYTSSLVNITNGPTRNTIQHCTLYDFGHKVGNGIGFDSTTASTYLQFVFDCEVQGFENGVFANCGSSSFFTNSNHFLKVNFWQGKRALKVTSVASAAFDDNTFELCQMQAYAGTLCGFDYDSSGRALYTKHTNVMVWDLPGATQYALVNGNTEMTLSGCYPSHKIGGSGATAGKIRAFDNYTINRGTSTQSGNGTTKIFNIAHSLVAVPTRVNITPGSVDATGTPAVTKDATNVIITYPVAPPSGSSNLVWNWEASVF